MSTTLINYAAIELLMTLGKRTFGVVAITTIVLMFATTIVSAMQNAEAQRGGGGTIRAQGGDTRINQENDASQRSGDQAGLVNVGNLGVQANVGVPVEACVGVLGAVNCGQ